MSHQEQIAAFGNEVANVIDRFREEFDLPYSSVIGTLQIHIAQLSAEALKEDADEDT